MENSKQIKKDRVFSFDLMRIIAIMAVVMIHVTSQFITRFQSNTLQHVLGCILNSVSRFGVPLFFMISGALMLNENKQLSLRGCILKALRLFILLVIWSLFYAVVKEIAFPIVEHKSVVFKSFMIAFIYGNYHLWFLYALIGLYLITPLLRFIIKKANMKIIMYFLSLCVIFVYIPNIAMALLVKFGIPNYLGVLSKFGVPIVGAYIGYYVLGYYLFNKEIDKRHRIIVYVVGGISLLATVLGSIFINYDMFFSYGTITVFLYSMAVFVFIKELTKGKVSSEKVALFSNLSFGVYLLHAFILGIVFRYLPHFEMPYLFIPLIFVVVTVITYGICFFVSKIPYINKLIKV